MSAVKGLTAYEAQRQPMKRLPDDTEVTIPIRSVNQDLHCPVCLGILNATYATKDCLHRFCSECISTSLRVGKRECPSCRLKCPSRRSLRADTNFDDFIRTIYPNRESLEASEAKIEEQVLSNQKALAESLDKGLRRQQSEARQSSARATSSSATSAAGVKRKATDDAAQQEALATLAGQQQLPPSSVYEPAPKRPVVPAVSEIEFALVNLATDTNPLPALEKKYIKTSVNCTVQHLCKYLGIKLNNGVSANDFQIVLLKNKSHVILAPYMSLEFILDQYWKNGKDLILYYSHKGAVISNSSFNSSVQVAAAVSS